MTYEEYVSTMKVMLVIGTGNTSSFDTILPLMIEYAENRIRRDLDILYDFTTITSDCTSGLRNVQVPQEIDILNSISIITPSGVSPDEGTRNPVQRTTVEFINYSWNQSSSIGVPNYYALLNTETMILSPTPDEDYTIEWNGVTDPEPLSASNPETYISTYIPDIFVVASMIFGSGYQRDFGQMSDDPKVAQSWESQYQTLIQSEAVREFRRKAQAQSWQPFSPSPLAPQSRT